MIRIACKSKIIRAKVSLTSSKSISNRVLMIRALSPEKFEIENLASSSDTKILDESLQNLSPVIDVNDAGTPFRFLTAYLAMKQGTFLLTGNERMKRRPIKELVDALRSLGANIEYPESENFPPLKITGNQLQGTVLNIDAGHSSQFVSAILLIAPLLPGGLTIEFSGENSKPYITMTLGLMEYFGINISQSGNRIICGAKNYQPRKIKIENDWSAASFWYVIAALSAESEITLCGLKLNSIQGDSVIAHIMKNFGIKSVESGDDILIIKNKSVKLPDFFEYDFSSCPDLAVPVAIACAALKIRSKFSGIKNLRIKESDRVHALKEEFSKIGVALSETADEFTIDSFDGMKFNTFFHSHHDHRIIMSLTALALLNDVVIVDHPEEVGKSYPEFWRQISEAGFICEII